MDATSQRAPVTPQDRVLIRASLSELARAARTCALHALGAPSPNSLLLSFSSSDLNLETQYGPSLFTAACDSIALSVVAAADSVDSLVMCLKAERATVSTGVLTRAALEAFGRAYFLLRAESAQHFFHHYLSLAHEELKYPERYSGLTNEEGIEIDGRAYRAELAKLSANIGHPKLAEVSLSALVANVLRPAISEPVDPEIYSQLSGVAHGAFSALGMFLERSPTGWAFKFPRDIALEYTGYLYAAIVTVADRAVELAEPAAPVRERWQAARDRSSAAIRVLQESLTVL